MNTAVDFCLMGHLFEVLFKVFILSSCLYSLAPRTAQLKQLLSNLLNILKYIYNKKKNY